MVWRRLQDERGSQIVEFVFIVPVLIFLVFSVPIFGLIVRAQIVAEGAAREGARYLGIYHDQSGARDRVAQELTEYGGLKERDGRNGTTLFNKYSDVVPSESGGWATVTVTYRQPTFIPGIGRLIGANVNLGSYFTVRANARFRSEVDRWR